MNTKIRPEGRIGFSREKRLDAVAVKLYFVNSILHKSVNKNHYTK
ncbi:conserved hypothetical protein [Sphingobacterium multivorum]|uniref:Uncharacterized protein n=1 Tax=Sphingobacterium multivorum TaxID=28454 RepID=A0A653ZNE3_SPHMU|nr:conserved hypothetical protein [Sphingobacterium multivorum]